MEVQTMTKVLYSILSALFSCVTLYEGSDINDNLTKEPGHMKPFGSGRPIRPIEELKDFPDPKTFFNEYFFKTKPVKIKNGARKSPAFEIWTDEYFLNLDIPEDSPPIHTETLKKEDRSQDIIQMKFKDLVKIYKNSSYYMVDKVQDYLRKDVVIPFSIQCPDLIDKGLDETIIWLSGGGTSSVVHADGSDNLNCVYRGTKDFVMIDPLKYENLVDMDGSNSGYSLMDVDQVDYLKYPGMAKVEFVLAHLDEGDCLFIPSGWIHQVRSYNISLAVNIWWNHIVSNYVDIDGCNKEYDENLTLDKVKMAGVFQPMTIRTLLLPLLESDPTKSISLDDFMDTMHEYYLEGLDIKQEKIEKFLKMYEKMFTELDKNSDGLFTLKEFLGISLEDLKRHDKTFVLSENLHSLHSVINKDQSAAVHTEL